MPRQYRVGRVRTHRIALVGLGFRSSGLELPRLPFRPVSYPDVHPGQTALRLLDCPRSPSSRPRRRDPRPASPTRRPGTVASCSAAVDVLGPGSLGLPPPSLERLEGQHGPGQAGNRDRLAPPCVRLPPTPFLRLPRALRSCVRDRRPNALSSAAPPKSRKDRNLHAGSCWRSPLIATTAAASPAPLMGFWRTTGLPLRGGQSGRLPTPTRPSGR